MSKSVFKKLILPLLCATCLFGCSQGASGSGNSDPFTLIEEGVIEYDYVTDAETPYAVMTLDGKPFSFDGKIFVGDTDKELDSLVAGDKVSVYEDRATKEMIVKCEPAAIAEAAILTAPGSTEPAFYANRRFGYNYLEYGINEDMSINKAPNNNRYYVSGKDKGLLNSYGESIYQLMAMYQYKVSIKNRTFLEFSY